MSFSLDTLYKKITNYNFDLFEIEFIFLSLFTIINYSYFTLVDVGLSLLSAYNGLHFVLIIA